MSVEKNIMNRKNGAPMINIIYDGILGIYEMSKSTEILSSALFNDICVAIDHWPSKIQPNTAMETLSLALPPRFNLFTDTVAIINGIIKKGPITVETTKKIITKLHQEYPSQTVIQFIDRAQFITNKWMQNKGYSFCFMDAAREPISFQDQFPPNITTEQRKLTYLNNIRDSIPKVNKENGFLTMVTAGSKGTHFNYTQCSAMLGQQAIDGVRIKKQFNKNTRLLPHFPFTKEDIPTHGGFVTGNLFTGLKPTEMYIHIMSGMKGVIDTGKGTAQTGYLARQLMKTLENVVVSESNQVVLNDKIIQFHSSHPPGTRVGSIAAMSISETSTQMTLNSFHFAGDSNMTTQGFPRVRELTRLTDAKPVIRAQFTTTVPVLKQVLVADLIEHAFILPADPQPLWELVHQATIAPNNKYHSFKGTCIELHFHSRFMDAIQAIQSTNFTITHTHPKYEFIARIHLADSSFKKTCQALKNIKKIIVSGVDGVRDQYSMADNTVNLLINRNKAGNVLRTLLSHPQVIKTSITTNAPSIMNEWGGIELTRLTLYNEFKQIMAMYDSHYSILCDTMCQSHSAQSILKTGVIQNIKESIFNQACYEETFDILTSGAAEMQTDACNDVSTRIMVGAPINKEIITLTDEYSPEEPEYSPSKQHYSPSKDIQNKIARMFD
jgi:DNA-directed RNA polymerase beta' subunit